MVIFYPNTRGGGLGWGRFGAKLRKYTWMEIDTVQGYDKLWADPRQPKGVAIGEDMNRDVQYREEQSCVKALASTTSQSYLRLYPLLCIFPSHTYYMIHVTIIGWIYHDIFFANNMINTINPIPNA